MDITSLKNEITADAQHLGYAGKSDAQVAQLLNARTIAATAPLGSSVVLKWAAAQGLLSKLQTTAADATATDALRSVCLAALALVQRADVQLDVADTQIEAMVSALKTAGIVSDAAQASLTALAAGQISRGEQLWGAGTVISHQQTAAARKQS
jgi:hypothetical protein